jgi:hypothetical protein
MEAKISLLYSQESVTDLYREPEQSIPHPTILFF